MCERYCWASVAGLIAGAAFLLAHQMDGRVKVLETGVEALRQSDVNNQLRDEEIRLKMLQDVRKARQSLDRLLESAEAREARIANEDALRGHAVGPPLPENEP